MDIMKHFSIPFKGLKNGDHRFQFEIGDDFFKHYENDVITNGQFNVWLDFEKKDNMSIMQFSIEGISAMNCDRCMEIIQLPIQGKYDLLLKFGDEEDSNEEVMYVDPDISILPLGQLMYEFILLSIPITKVYNCQEDNPRPCNDEILDKLEYDDNGLPPTSNSIWDNLKGIDFDNN
jgi:uncharacterized metal-binding protein YceD (DUF177 family)